MKLLKKLWPDSLYGQILLMVLLAIAALQAINLHAIRYIQKSYMQEFRKVRFDYDSSLYMALVNMNSEQRETFLKNLSQAQRSLGLNYPTHFGLLPKESDWISEPSNYVKEVAETMNKALAAGSEDEPDLPVIKARVLNEPTQEVYGAEKASSLSPLLQVAIQMDDGSWIELIQPLTIANRNVIWMYRLFIILESLLFAFLIVWVIRRATRPLYRLGRSAEQFGCNPEIMRPLAATGSREIREAAQSFNRMRARICNNLANRNRMLEAMGHDLRTPLARIQLRLEKIQPEELRNQFAANIDEVESIIEQGLELARSMHTSEKPVLLDIVAFVQSLVDDLQEQGYKVVLSDHPDMEESSPILIAARPTCLKRCLENLLINAVKYGGGAAISIFQRSGKVIIDVSDEGPGIPEEYLEKVFEPYYRLERSRNRDSGGAGLGLSIARNMVLLNNGSLYLKNRPGGGLTARIQLDQEPGF